MSTKKPTLLLLLLQILLLQLARCQHYDDQSEAFQALLGKQQQQRPNRQQVYNITWLWTTPASAVPNKFQMDSLETFTEPAESQEKIEITEINKSQQKRQQKKTTKPRRQKKKARKVQAKEDANIAGIRSDLMREFASKHGERIRRSRRYADLFDGSGYLLDHMEELRQYESGAKEHHHRQRRSADNSKDSKSDFNPDEELPNFSSLTELLKHLNDGPQGDIIQAGLNLRFVEEKLNRRQKRSNSDDINNDDDEEDNWSREREAEASIKRLDAMLQDLARYLDQEHLDAAEDNKDQSIPPFMTGFNKQLSGAHKALVQLRDMLMTAAASGRMSSMHAMPHKSANWQVNAESLRDNVQQLRQVYRQMDEL